MTTDNKTLAVDVLAVLRRHAESHRASAETDAYSAQEAPQLDGAVAAVAELIKTVDLLQRKAIALEHLTSFVFTSDIERVRAALARVKGESA